MRAFSTTFAGTGGSAGEINSGEARDDTAGSGNDESGVPNRVVREGKCGPAAVAAEVIVVAGEDVAGAIELDPDHGREVDGSSGMDEIDATDGNDAVTMEVLLPVSGHE